MWSIAIYLYPLSTLRTTWWYCKYTKHTYTDPTIAWMLATHLKGRQSLRAVANQAYLITFASCISVFRPTRMRLKVNAVRLRYRANTPDRLPVRPCWQKIIFNIFYECGRRVCRMIEWVSEWMSKWVYMLMWMVNARHRICILIGIQFRTDGGAYRVMHALHVYDVRRI